MNCADRKKITIIKWGDCIAEIVAAELVSHADENVHTHRY